MDKKLKIAVALCATITAFALSFWYVKTNSLQQQITGENTKEYTNQKIGIAFSYPATYFLEEKNIGSGEREIDQIQLTEDTEENRLVREGKTPPREGPTAITITTYQNNRDNQTIEEWIKNTSALNFKLSPDGVLEKTIITKNTPALTYRWSGLYEGRTIVFAHNDYIVAISVTSLTPQDTIIKDFESLVNSITLK